MELKFQDFYGQFVTVHDHTSSGNIRLNIKTMNDMNTIRGKKPEEMEVETDIALDLPRAKLLLTALEFMLKEELLP